EPVVKEIMIGEWDPKTIKDEITALELEPLESTRISTTKGWTLGGSAAWNGGLATSTTRSTTRAKSKQWGSSSAHSDSSSLVHGTSHSAGTNSGMTDGESTLPTGDIIAIANATEGASEINSEMASEASTSADSYGAFEAEGVQEG